MTQITACSSSFVRPNNTTTYTSGDLVADSTTAGSVNPLQFTLPTGNFKLHRVSLVKSSTTTSNATFRLHFYSSKPVVSHGDNAAWLSTQSDYLGDIEIDCTLRTFSDDGQGFGLYVASDVPSYLALDTTSLIIYALLEVRASYVPTAKETFTITLFGETY